MSKPDYMQPNDWDAIYRLLLDRAEAFPPNDYRRALVCRFVRTRDVCEPVLKAVPGTRKRQRKK